MCRCTSGSVNAQNEKKSRRGVKIVQNAVANLISGSGELLKETIGQKDKSDILHRNMLEKIKKIFFKVTYCKCNQSVIMFHVQYNVFFSLFLCTELTNNGSLSHLKLFL